MEQLRAMRRKRQQLSEEDSISILQKSTAGSLALLRDNDYPYAVPFSYVYGTLPSRDRRRTMVNGLSIKIIVNYEMDGTCR